MHPLFKCATLLVCLVCGALRAEEIWLLIPDGSKEIVGIASPQGWRELSEIGSSPVYGSSNKSIAFISYRAASATFIVDVFDRLTRRISFSWPAGNENAVRQLSGASRDLVVGETAVYYLTLKNGGGMTPFVFNELQLSDGAVEQVPLGDLMSNPRLAAYEGRPVLHSWNGARAMEFSEADRKFTDLVFRLDLPQTLSREEADERNRVLPAGSYAEFVFLERVGLFRLSTNGAIQQVLDASLKPLDRETMVTAGADASRMQVFPINSKAEPAIGIITQNSAGATVASIDPVSGHTNWASSVPSSIVALSATGSEDGAVYYIDPSASAVSKVSGEGKTVVAILPLKELSHGRIVAITQNQAAPTKNIR
jgi:hypothetical protein